MADLPPTSKVQQFSQKRNKAAKSVANDTLVARDRSVEGGNALCWWRDAQ